jgi:hypothetical protein
MKEGLGRTGANRAKPLCTMLAIKLRSLLAHNEHGQRRLQGSQSIKTCRMRPKIVSTIPARIFSKAGTEAPKGGKIPLRE